MPHCPRNDPWKTDPDILRWKTSLSASGTGASYYSGLSLFLVFAGRGPHDYVKSSQAERDNLAADYVTALAKQRLSKGTIKCRKAAIASWLDWNSLRFGRKIKIPKSVPNRPRASKSRIPDNTGLAAALNAGDARSRNATCLIAHGGFRPEVLGSDTMGLRLSDFKNARLTPDGLVFDRIPCLVVVPEELSKTGMAYLSFIGPEACEYLAADVKARLQAGIQVTLDSPAVASANPRKPFLDSASISGLIRKPMVAAGVREVPYIWRSYFSNRCMMAQNRGLLAEWREFFMGHATSVASLYNVNKVLPPDMVEAMRSAYQGALKYLETKTPMLPEDPTLEWLSVLLQSAGCKADDVAPSILAGKSQQEIVAMLKTAFQAQGRGTVMQRIVVLGELDSLLLQGWSFRAALPDGRAVVEHA